MQPSLQQALVLRVDAKVCHVEVDGQSIQLPLAGKLFETKTRQKQPLAVGDLVVLDPTGRSIDAVLPRTSQLSRRSSSEGEARSQILAANITRVLVVTSIAEPRFQSELVDGVLAAAAREQIPATLIITKQDLDPAASGAWTAVYERIGVPVLATSTTSGHETPATLARVAELLHSNRSVLCGISGAGKSSLLNAVVPGVTLRIGSLNHIRQGRHTTTHTELISLPGGGHVLDTPGVRNFHLFCVGSQELQFLFPEIGKLLPQCAYRSCLHGEDAGDCAVRAALARGEIAKSRYASYLTMLNAAVGAENPDWNSKDTKKSGGRWRRHH